MKNVILTVLKIIGVVILILAILVAALLFWLSKRPFVPNNYTRTVETGGRWRPGIWPWGPMR